MTKVRDATWAPGAARRARRRASGLVLASGLFATLLLLSLLELLTRA